MTILTPSYADDVELCADLHRSVLRHAPPSIEHHLVVPGKDVQLFSQLSGPRLRIHREEDFLPRSFVRLPRVNFTINVRRPFPPIRGWIRQQVLKLAAASRLHTDVVVLVDSDIEFIRPFTADTFHRGGTTRFYRSADDVTHALPRHVLWHAAARRLLGLPAASPPLPDYVSSLVAWDPAVVRNMLTHVERVTGQPWATAVGCEVHFSEWTLYGVYVDEVLPASGNGFDATTSLCHSYWDETPLGLDGAVAFVGAAGADDIAVMISAKSNTAIDVRRAAMRQAPV